MRDIAAPHPSSALPLEKGPGYTYIYFGENQLSPSPIGILPLTTSRPSLLQQTLVRASPHISVWFTLLMVSSPGFGFPAASLSR